MLGPSLGGVLLEHLSWPFVFWVNLPVGVLSIVMISVFLKETVQPRRHQIDWQGSLLLLVAISALMLALVEGGTLDNATLAALLAIGIGALIALFLHERIAPEPTLPLELWRNRVIVVGSLGCGSAAAVMMGVSASLPTYVQGAMGRSAVAGGLMLGVMSISWALASIFAGRIMARTTYRLVASLGAVALLAGCAILALLTPEAELAWAAFGSLVIGIGMGFCITVFMVSVQSAVPWRQRGAATSSVMFLRFVGQSVGAAGCGAALNATMLHLDPAAAHMVDKLLETRITRRNGTGGDRAPHRSDRALDAQRVSAGRGVRVGDPGDCASVAATIERVAADDGATRRPRAGERSHARTRIACGPLRAWRSRQHLTPWTWFDSDVI